MTGEPIIGYQRYGKAKVRVVKVNKETNVKNSIKEVDVLVCNPK
jgi:hypothetical protein